MKRTPQPLIRVILTFTDPVNGPVKAVRALVALAERMSPPEQDRAIDPPTPSHQT